MPIEDPNKIDIITAPAPGSLALLITDAGVPPEPAARLALFRAKLARYVGYVATQKFEQEYPDVSRDRVTIVLVSRFEATPEMKAISRVSLPQSPITLPVVFDLLPDSVTGF